MKINLPYYLIPVVFLLTDLFRVQNIPFSKYTRLIRNYLKENITELKGKSSAEIKAKWNVK